MMFNKSIFLDNLEFYMKRDSIKASELEELAGVSKGYISRLKKSGNQTIPGIDFLLVVASKFEITVETLCTINCSLLSNDERFYIDLLNSLIIKTKNKDIVWKRYTLNQLINNKYEDQIAEKESLLPEGLISIVSGGGNKYRSTFDYGDYRVTSTGSDFYCIKIDEIHLLCMVMVNLSNQERNIYGMEMFMLTDKIKSNVCCIDPYSPSVYIELFIQLFNLVKDTINVNCMDQKTRMILNKLLE